MRAVFVFEGNDLSVYPSVEEAASYVEAIDVDNGEFDFFAEDGMVLSGGDAQRAGYAARDQRPATRRPA